MQVGIFYLLNLCIFFNQHELSNAKPMVGNTRRANRGQFTFVVSIKKINNTNPEPERDHGCTGSLVSPRLVLTVEHGVNRMPMHKMEVVVGHIDIRQGTKYNISNIITYNQWAQARGIALKYDTNDIAIVMINGVVPDSITPAVMSQIPAILLFGFEATIAGWGLEINDLTPRLMNYGIVNILRKEDCKDRIINFTGRVTDIHNRFMCSHARPYVILRPGDSGGPLLMANGELIGINRASCPNPERDFSDRKVNIHIGIDFYRNFIVNVIATFMG